MFGNLLAGIHPSCGRRRRTPPKRRALSAAAAATAATEGNSAFSAEIGTNGEIWACTLADPKHGGLQPCMQILSCGRCDALANLSTECGIVEEEPGMRSRNDTSALRRHVPPPGVPRRPPATVQIHNQKETTQGEETWTKSIIAWKSAYGTANRERAGGHAHGLHHSLQHGHEGRARVLHRCRTLRAHRGVSRLRKRPQYQAHRHPRKDGNAQRSQDRWPRATRRSTRRCSSAADAAIKRLWPLRSGCISRAYRPATSGTC